MLGSRLVLAALRWNDDENPIFQIKVDNAGIPAEAVLSSGHLIQAYCSMGFVEAEAKNARDR